MPKPLTTSSAAKPKPLAPVDEAPKTVALFRSRISALDTQLLLTITTPADCDIAVGQRAQLKEIAKELKAKKDTIIKPLTAATKAVRDLFAPVELDLDGAIDDITEALAEWNAKVKAELAAKRARLETRVDEGTMSESKANLLMAKKSEALGVEAIPTRKVQVLIIDDLTAIPRDYFDLNEARVKAALREGKLIPGAHLEERDQIYNAPNR